MKRINRGSSWRSLSRYARVAIRILFTPDNRFVSLGLRIARKGQ